MVVLELDRLDLLLQSLEDIEQGRHNHNLAEHTDEHTAYGCCTKSHVTVVAYTPRHEQWQKTDNHSQ